VHKDAIRLKLNLNRKYFYAIILKGNSAFMLFSSTHESYGTEVCSDIMVIFTRI